MTKGPRPPSRLRRLGGWLRDVIGNAGVTIGASSAMNSRSRGGAPGVDQFLGTALLIDRARRTGDESDPPDRD